MAVFSLDNSPPSAWSSTGCGRLLSIIATGLTESGEAIVFSTDPNPLSGIASLRGGARRLRRRKKRTKIAAAISAPAIAHPIPMPAAAPGLMSFDLGEELRGPALVVELPLDDELYPDPAVTGPFGEAVGELETGFKLVLAAVREEGAPFSGGLGASVGGWNGDDLVLSAPGSGVVGCCPGAPTLLINPSGKPPAGGVVDARFDIEPVTMLAHRI